MNIKLILAIIALLFSTGFLEARHVILCGGPALRHWENLRVKEDQHDKWWANFIRSSTIRIDEIRKFYPSSSKVVWIVHKPGYIERSFADRKPYINWIKEQAEKRGVTLKWISSGKEAIRAINSQRNIKTFDYFGHSNKHCLMLDYGAKIMAASKDFIHEKDLHKIRKKAFAPNAICQSYGCHTGESMSQTWKKTLGIPLIGATGKTDYVVVGSGKLPITMVGWAY